MRMTQSTFLIFHNELHPYIVREITQLKLPFSVDQRVAVTIWKLTTNVEYRTLSELFGIDKSSVCEIVNDTCRQLVMRLLPKYVKMPQGDILKEIVEGFETCWGFHRQ